MQCNTNQSINQSTGSIIPIVLINQSIKQSVSTQKSNTAIWNLSGIVLLSDAGFFAVPLTMLIVLRDICLIAAACIIRYRSLPPPVNSLTPLENGHSVFINRWWPFFQFVTISVLDSSLPDKDIVHVYFVLCLLFLGDRKTVFWPFLRQRQSFPHDHQQGMRNSC